jgi:hypothetical protein
MPLKRKPKFKGKKHNLKLDKKDYVIISRTDINHFLYAGFIGLTAYIAAKQGHNLKITIDDDEQFLKGEEVNP